MKEASGEANLTVITIILIGVVVAVATPLVNSLMTSSACRACCTDAGGVWKGNACTGGGGTNRGYSAEAYNSCTAELEGTTCPAAQ